MLPSLTETFRLTDAADVGAGLERTRVVMPLMSLRRGSTIADLTTEDAASCQLVVLPRYLGRALSFELLFSPLALGDTDRTDQILARLDDPDRAEHRLFKILGRDQPTPLQEVTSIVVDIAVDYHLPLFGYRRLLENATFLAKYFFHWIEVPGRPGELLTLSYSYRSPFRSQQRPAKLSTAARRSRRAHGPYLLLETPNPTSARSYNLRMEAPAGHYVAQQTFLVPDNSLPESLDRWGHFKRAISPAPAEATFQPLAAIVAGRAAQDVRVYDGVRGIRGYVHMNVLNLDQKDVGRREVWASILLAERPPGSAGVGAALAGMVLVLLWLTYWAGAADMSSARTDVAVVALGVPGLVALWLQDVIGGQAKAHVTALTKSLLWLSAAASLSGVGYITWESLHDGEHPSKWWAVLICTRWIFSALGACLLVALSFQLVRLVRDSREYRRRAKIGIDEIAKMTNS